MAIQTLSYTGRDVAEIRRQLIDMIPTLTSKWTDFNQSDLGIILIELIAGAQDMQNFYFDTQAFETYLDTAVQEKNIYSLVRAMNYRLPLMCSARGTIRINFEERKYRELKIPKYTVVRSTYADISQKYSVSDTVIANGTYSYIDIPIIEGEVRSLKITKGSLRSNMTSSGNISRRIYLGYTNVADHTVEIVQDGVFWNECDDALLKYNGGYYYSVHRDSEGQVYVLLPVDFMKRLPTSDEDYIEIKFITTSGLDGQVTADSLNSIDMDIDGVSDITNVFSTGGAADDINLDRLKILAREKAITMDRYITLEDYKNGVETENYVKDCVVKDWKYPKYVDKPYVVKVWAVDASGQSVNNEIAKSIITKLESKGVVDVSIEVMPVEIVEFNVEANVTVNVQKNSEKDRVREAIEKEMKIFFQPDSMRFGYYMTYADIRNTIMASSNKIKKVLLTSPSENINLTEIQYPKVGKISINIVDEL